MATQTTTQQMASTNFNLLKNALRGNAVFSIISAAIALVASSNLAEVMDIEPTLPFIIVGVGLVIWTIEVYAISSQEPIRLNFVRMIIAGDLMWVLGSAVLLLFDPFEFSTEGKWLVLVLADIVLTFAIMQYVGLRRAQR